MGRLIDLTGRRFGRWTVVAIHCERCEGRAFWLCHCACGTERVVRGTDLRNGKSTGCGCSKGDDLVGKRFGRWTVVAFYPKRYWRGRDTVWLCHCDCGTERGVRGFVLRNGESKSCGCLQRELVTKRLTTHGMSKTRAYSIWENMKQRCQNPNSTGYHYWGGAGIGVCDRWQKFENFYADMGEPPDGLTLDRKDNDKGYSLENCKWSTRLEQVHNRRPPKQKGRRADLAEIEKYAVALARANGRGK